MKPDKQPDKGSPGNNAEEDETTSTGQSPITPDPDGVDARDDPGKLKENRDRLGVDDEHKTPDMKEHQRGTFP